MSTTHSPTPNIHLHENPTGDYLRLRQIPEEIKSQIAHSDNTLSGIFNEVKYAYREYTVQKTTPNTTDHDEMPAGTLYLFNVIVALEWCPTKTYRLQLQEAFRQASNYLVDVSDGQMAFGHVLFAGPELMPYADIQIMASNRLHPRSWKEGLFSQQVRAIRVGRGLWNSDLNASIGWDEPAGYRTLVHEWGHYALGLDDEYTGTVKIESHNSEQTLIIPSYSANNPSVMTSISWSEMLEEKDPTILNTIRSHYAKFEPRELAGPYYLPFPFPKFHFCISRASPQDDPGSWLYLLQKSQDNAFGFDRLLALGSLEHSSLNHAFELPNINPQNHYVQLIKIKNQEHDIMTTVVPLSSDEVQVFIKHHSGPTPSRLQLFSQGNSSRESVIKINMPKGQRRWLSDAIKVPSLDGHLLLQLTTGQLMIYPFSQGGMGPNHNPVSAPTAGSADGNVMIFFGDSHSTEASNDLQLITTRSYAPSGSSLIYSIASNQPLPQKAPDEPSPTLLLYYEFNSTRSASKYRPILRRLKHDASHLQHEESWQPLETYAPYGRAFVAIPLNEQTAPNLTNLHENLRIESYQLYWEAIHIAKACQEHHSASSAT